MPFISILAVFFKYSSFYSSKLFQISLGFIDMRIVYFRVEHHSQLSENTLGCWICLRVIPSLSIPSLSPSLNVFSEQKPFRACRLALSAGQFFGGVSQLAEAFFKSEVHRVLVKHYKVS